MPNQLEPNQPGSAERDLHAEIADLRRQLEERDRQLGHRQGSPRRPSRGTLVALALAAAVLTVVGFFTGYTPRERRESVLANEARAEASAIPTVNVAMAERAPGRTELALPGSIQAVEEAPVLARASGYVKKRYADIGDRVAAGQLLAEIEAPELGRQVEQSRAQVQQTRAALEQAIANLAQGRTNEQLARTTSERWNNLAAKGVVSRQEKDNYQAQYESQRASVTALDKAVAAARSNVTAAEANLARLTQVEGYQKVRAPFAGVITVRNVDAGALIGEGNTLLYRIAKTDRLRIYISVPQASADAVRRGQAARITLPDLPGREFPGTVARTSNSLDPSTRTLLTEIELANGGGALLPGMYARVGLATPRDNPPLLIPGDTLVMRSDGPQVAVVAPDGRIHYHRIKLGRDFGEKLEVLSGIEPGDRLAVNPGDAAREGVLVNPVPVKEKKEAKRPA
jgi:RND family efflux transporter MFP subunit